MNKKEVKNILISMRTPENEIAVNHLLGQLDMKSINCNNKCRTFL